MLSKKRRIIKKDFQTLMKKGKIFSNQLFSFYFLNNKPSQYAFVAPRGVFKTAVKRNKYRRIGYSILKSTEVSSGVGIFIYKKRAITSTKEEIKENIIFLLKKAKII